MYKLNIFKAQLAHFSKVKISSFISILSDLLYLTTFEGHRSYQDHRVYCNFLFLVLPD